MPRMREFNPSVLEQYVDHRLAISWSPYFGLWGKVWAFTVFLPRFLINPDGHEVMICTALDEELLRDMLVRHFGGCTVSQYPIQGI